MEEYRIYRGHSHWINAIAWVPTGKLIASDSLDCTVQVWYPLTGAALLLNGEHQDPVRSVVWSPESELVVSGGTDKAVYVWQVSAQQPV